MDGAGGWEITGACHEDSAVVTDVATLSIEVIVTTREVMAASDVIMP